MSLKIISWISSKHYNVTLDFVGLFYNFNYYKEFFKLKMYHLPQLPKAQQKPAWSERTGFPRIIYITWIQKGIPTHVRSSLFNYVTSVFEMHFGYSYSICFRTCSSAELRVVSRKCICQSWGIPGNTVCRPTVCVLLEFCCAFTDKYYVTFLKSVGDLRFAPPEPPLAFAGVRQTTKFGAACPQQAMDISFIPGLGSRNASTPASSEDCRTVVYAYYLTLF